MNKTNKQKLSQLAIGIMFAFAPFYSFAGGELTQVGEQKNKSFNQTPLKGFANELPLLTVMKQITPNGWVVKKSDTEDSKLDTKKSISWKGGKSWVDTLTDISENYNINTVVDWNKKVITLSNAITKPKEVEKKSLFVLEGTEAPKTVKDVAVGSSEQTADTVKEVVSDSKNNADKVEQIKVEVATQTAPPAPPAPPTWNLESTLSLKDNVEKWANTAGYRLVWTGEDYSVGQAHTITGEFDSENGPIKQLSVDYGPSSRVQVPLSFQFYQNKTLVVENWVFEQSGFPQFNKKN